MRALGSARYVTLVSHRARHAEARLTDYGRWYARAALAWAIDTHEESQADTRGGLQ